MYTSIIYILFYILNIYYVRYTLIHYTAPPPPGALLRSIPEDQQLPLDQVRGQNYDLY